MDGLRGSIGSKSFVTLGMFIIDEFSFADEKGLPTARIVSPQIGGGGTFAAIGARIWLPPSDIGMIVDKGNDFPASIEKKLLNYGQPMWLFRPQPLVPTTRGLNSYRGDVQSFQYTTSRIRLTPKDLEGSDLSNPKILHFICSPSRAVSIITETKINGWQPITIFEPIPERCIPEELPKLIEVLPSISILSPNAVEALSLLSLPLPPTKSNIESAADQFLEFGIGNDCEEFGWVIIRAGGLGAYLKSKQTQGIWVEAFWTDQHFDKIVDVTGAGNSFLGGLAAGITMSGGNMLQAAMYGAISASFVIEQEGLPSVAYGSVETWNGDTALSRLETLRKRHENRIN